MIIMKKENKKTKEIIMKKHSLKSYSLQALQL